MLQVQTHRRFLCPGAGTGGAFDDFLAPVLTDAINALLSDPKYLAILKLISGKKGLSYRGYREVGLRVLNGREIRVKSPYFFKKRGKKPGRKKTKRSKGNNAHCHPGLALMGFVSRCSPFLVSEGNKRQGYHCDWYEPKLITIYLVDSQGQVVDSFKPLYDATMGRADDTFKLLERYLKELPMEQLERVVFCGDGAPWIWERVESMIKPLLPQNTPLHQVIDYTHAKQALGRIRDLLPKKLTTKMNKKIWKEWEKALWEGETDQLKELISKQFKTRNRAKVLKKWKTYFKSNEKRMQYAEFKQIGVPCGSGSVESAIRRVINLRMKAPGTFWTKEMAEVFLFLRAQLISGRWDIFFRNLRRSMLFDIDRSEIHEQVNRLKTDFKLWALSA